MKDAIAINTIQHQGGLNDASPMRIKSWDGWGFKLSQGLVLDGEVDDELGQVLVIHAVVIIQLSAHFGHQGQMLQPPELVHFEEYVSNLSLK